MIDGHNKKEKEVETRISKGLQVSPIIFIIYISEGFEKVKLQLLRVVLLLSIHDLRFIALGTSSKEIIKIFEEVGVIVLDKSKKNVITYDIVKTELVLSSYIHE